MSLVVKKSGLQGATDTDVWFAPVVSGAGFNSDFVAFTTTTQFAGVGATMAAGQLFCFTATVDCWIAQGANPTATKGAGSMFVQKGVQVVIDGSQGAKLAVLQDVGGGNASLVQITA
jgi:hypothetical protein